MLVQLSKLLNSLVQSMNTESMYKKNILVSHKAAFSDSAYMNVLFSDKTGTITEGKGDGDWKQHMNGQDIRIKSPVVMNRHQHRICRQAMDAAGMKEISFRVAGVFSNRHVTLDTGKDCGLWTKDSFFEELKTQLAVEEERISDPQKVVDQLVAITKKIRPEKKKKA